MSSQVIQSVDGRQRVFIIPLGDGRYRLIEKTKDGANFLAPASWPKRARALPGVFESIAAARAEISAWPGFVAR